MIDRKTCLFGFISGFLLALAVFMLFSELRALEPTFQMTTVVHIVDGDTITIQHASGKKEYVRLIGIDTPETVDQRKKVQCFGREASARMKELLAG